MRFQKKAVFLRFDSTSVSRLMLLVILLLSACSQTSEPEEPTSLPPTSEPVATELIETVVPPTETPATSTLEPEEEEIEPIEESVDIIPQDILISAIQTGAQGNNLSELIELYNPLEQAIDLKGYTLTYHAKDSFEPKLLKVWRVRSDIPAGGYYLLGQEGELFDVLLDETFDETMISRGLLTLTNPNGDIADLVAFGDPPLGERIGEPAVAVPNGASLVRQHSGPSVDNLGDFQLMETHLWRNSGTPAVDQPVTIEIELPEVIHPGDQFVMAISIDGDVGEGGILTIPLPDQFDVMYAGQPLSGQRAEIAVDQATELPIELELTAPFTYQSGRMSGVYFSDSSGFRSYGPLLPLEIAEGAVPIAIARTLVNQTVTVEGVATMYTDGFFAGSTGTKFYIQDESGGVQIYIPGGKGGVEIKIGDRVRVTGQTEIYRTALEVIPGDFAADIEILDQAAELPSATEVLPGAVTADPAVMGLLTTVEGTATRIEERTYSYEIDIEDDEGGMVQVYIDKLTEATTEGLQVGERYRVTGIGESYDGQQQLYLRQQSDISRLFPPGIRVEVSSPTTTTEESVSLEIVIINDSPNPLTDTFVTTRRPSGPIREVTLIRDIVATENLINWVIPEIEGNGGRAVLPMTIHIDMERVAASVAAAEQIRLSPITATSPDWPDAGSSQAQSIFIGEHVPIWAIQGFGSSSGYVGETLSTEGVVTGIFPELGGFFVQASRPDFLNNTSDGIFVSAEEETDFSELQAGVGDWVSLTGAVRELAGQTGLFLDSLDQVRLLDAGDEPVVILPINLDPKETVTDTLDYYESLEGMLVMISEPAIAVAPSSQYGEYVLVPEDEQESIGGDGRVTKDIDPTNSLIVVDDGSTVRHENGATLPYIVQTGDRLMGITGPLAFTFGQYKIEPTQSPIIFSAPAPLPFIGERGASEGEALSVATFNVENFFDPFDPHPSSPPIPSLSEYEHKVTKLADAIARMGYPDIIALQEVENERVLNKLVEHPDMVVTYVPILLEGEDSRGIDNGYLVREGIVIHEVTQHPMPDGSLSRHPLMLDVTLSLEDSDSGIELILINNHFSSMSGGEEATEPRRLGQAEWVASLVGTLRAERPTANVIVLGDLNSFYESVPMDALRETGMNHVYEFTEASGEPRPYTYIFEGESETLDHIFVTPELFDMIVNVEALHINSDYPMADPEDASARRSSDHDPLIVTFELP